MFKRILKLAFAVMACSVAQAQGTMTVDLLDPSETTGIIPENLRIIDVFVDIATTDYWTAGGVRALTENGATLLYHDSDANIAGIQPGLFNPGVADKFTTSLSKPRGRDASSRFNCAYAAAAGGYNPPSPTVTTALGELNVAYFPGLPGTTTPSVDGYVARISIDVSGVPGALPQSSGTWRVGLLTEITPTDTVVLRSAPPPPPGTQSPGTVLATFDVPGISGISWGLWFIPEPSSLVFLVAGALFLRRR